MEQKSYYAIIPANIRYDEEIPANAKLLYGEITALCNDRGYCWASNDYFANLYKVSKKSISNWINSLIKKNYIYSQMIYRENSKQIQYRMLKLNNTPIEENVNTYGKNLPYPIEENFHNPMEKKVKDNNTYINNTINIYNVQFEKFYKLYPKKQSKDLTKKWFLKNKISSELFEKILGKLELFKKQWTDIKYVPMPITWLNQKRWEDEIIIQGKVITNSETKIYEIDPELQVQINKRRNEMYGGQR